MSQNSTDKPKANIFDIRNIIGALLGIYGVVLLVMSFSTSDSDLAKVSGVNANLWVGIGLLAAAIFFIAWAILRPIVVDEEQLEEDKRAVEEAAHLRRDETTT
jgi:drug/metabolite transporter (DMT)-like permease